MRRIALFSLAATLALGASLAAYRPFSPEAAPSLARYAPSGALLYLETRDFQSLLSSWNSSNEKRQWVASANYEMFSRSRLFSRLAAAGTATPGGNPAFPRLPSGRCRRGRAGACRTTRASG